MTSPSVYNTALQIVQSSPLATVVTQEVYVEVWRLAPRYDPSEGSVLAWMMSMAHRRSTEKVRAEADQPRVDGGRAPAHRGDDVDPRPEAARATRAMSALSENQRHAVVLAYVGGCSQHEVARILDLPVTTVASRIRDGLVDLRHALGVVGT